MLDLEVVIDPQRDYVSGGLELIERTSAIYLVNGADPVAFRAARCSRRQELWFGDLEVTGRATTGTQPPRGSLCRGREVSGRPGGVHRRFDGLRAHGPGRRRAYRGAHPRPVRSACRAHLLGEGVHSLPLSP